MVDNQKEWSVQVFRRVPTLGWEALHASSSATATTRHTTVRASLVPGAIVIRRLRLRVVLRNDTVLTRRQHCLRIQSATGVRVLVLRFPHPADCQAFGDALMRLNQNLLVSSTSKSSMSSSSSSSTLTSQVLGTAERESVLFYIARLLCDPEFMDMVTGLESTMLASPDGRKLLQDLEHLSPNDGNNAKQGGGGGGDTAQAEKAAAAATMASI